MEEIIRKNHRLKDYDYSCPNAYFITICTKDKQCILSKVNYSDFKVSADVKLTKIGEIVEKYINQTNQNYPNIEVEKFVIMPNHIHILYNVYEGNNVSLLQVVRALKRLVTNELGYSIWQKMSYDEIIDTVDAYENIWNYIDSNPLNWIIGKGDDY